MRRIAGVLALLLMAFGVAAVGFVAWRAADARTYQVLQRRQLAAERAEAIVPVVGGLARRVVDDGILIGELRLARIGLAVMVVEGASARILDRAVGHLAESALPGEPGNVVLVGHRDTFFRPLEHVRSGDAITVSTRDGDVDYLVEWTAVVPADAVHVLAPTGRDTLTLITCFPFSFIGAAPDRFIVRARAVGDSSAKRLATLCPGGSCAEQH